MATYLLDTSAILAHYRKEMGWQFVQALAEDSSAVLLLASPSITELMRRLDGIGLPELAVATAVEGYRSLVSEVVAISESTARLAADTGRQATARLPLTDCLIAAAARERQACLVHRDSHYLSIPAAILTQRDLTC